MKILPIILFVLDKQLADKIFDLTAIPKEINIYGENDALGGCTNYITSRAHFTGFSYSQQNDAYYLYDALKQRFNVKEDLSIYQGKQSLLIYFKVMQANENYCKRNEEMYTPRAHETSNC